MKTERTADDCIIGNRASGDGPGPEVMAAATLTGNPVRNFRGENLGKVEAIMLDVPAEVLKDAPGFDKDHWPSMADLTWASLVHDYYDVTPYWE